LPNFGAAYPLARFQKRENGSFPGLARFMNAVEQAPEGARRPKGIAMTELAQADCLGTEADMPTDLVAGLLMEMERARSARAPDRLTLKVYCVMAITTALTFATLVSGYQMLFTQQLFA
jgi:hypothetical protein